jgi:hypothetical protein
MLVMVRSKMAGSIERNFHSHERSLKAFEILALPPEIRRQIYSHMITLCGKDRISFLCTCKKLNLEAQESLLSKPLRFDKQGDLIRFTSNHSQLSLKHVHELRLCITDIDKDHMRPALAQIVLGLSKLTFQHPYTVEAKQTISAMRTLPNIRSLSIVEPLQAAEMPTPRILLNKILASIVHCYPAFII